MTGIKYKDNKPEMEKKRRSRINESLSCLKLLVLGEVRRKNTRISKLDKADILEMAVEYVQRMGATGNTPLALPARVDRYRAGFNACAEEVRRHLAQTPDVDIDVRTRIVDHLANFVQNLQWLRRHDILPHDVSVRQTQRVQSMQVAPLKDTNYRHLPGFPGFQSMKDRDSHSLLHHKGKMETSTGTMSCSSSCSSSRRVGDSHGIDRMANDVRRTGMCPQPSECQQNVNVQEHGLMAEGKGTNSPMQKGHTSKSGMVWTQTLRNSEQTNREVNGNRFRALGLSPSIREDSVNKLLPCTEKERGLANNGQPQGDQDRHNERGDVGISGSVWRPW